MRLFDRSPSFLFSAAGFFAAPLVLFLSACAAGPDFAPPVPPPVSSYEPGGMPAETETADGKLGAAQKFSADADIPGEWWTLFHSEPLNKLIAQSLKSSPDLEAAEAALREASENTKAAEGSWFPFIDAGGNVSRTKSSSPSTGKSTTLTLYNATVSLSYPLDIFGLTARTVEELGAQEDFQRFQLEAARITLTGNVVTAAVQEASLRGRIAAEHEIIDNEQKQLDLIQRQFDLGAAPKSAVLAQSAALAAAQAALPPLEEQLAQTRHQLSVLAGRFPSDEPAASFELADLTLPEDVPVSLPSKLVEQRPDIAASEATLHAASAAIGVATANMLPQITLSADAGSNAARLGDLFSSGTGIWSLAAGVAQPIFHGGELLHKRRGAEAAFDNAAALYKKTVLAAFKDVADTLHALQSDASALKADVSSERAAVESLNLAQQQFEAGAISYLGLLAAEQTEEQAKLALVQAEAQRLADTAALFVALGGGWWNLPPAGTATEAAAPAAAPVVPAEQEAPPSNIHSNPPAEAPTGGAPAAAPATPADI